MWARPLIRFVMILMLAAGSAACESSNLPAGALSPAQALRSYQQRAILQQATLAGYSDEKTIDAEIPTMSKNGHLLLRRTFSAPRSLIYTGVTFVGDNFVKSNVIYRLLSADVERVQDETGRKQAILDNNYKFSYKGTETIDGRVLYAFTLKPIRKDPGMFKGKVLIDPLNGHMVRALGRLSKSPSFWVKRVDFVQDYYDVGKFTMVSQIQSVSQARMVGRVVVNIHHRKYEVCPARISERSCPEPNVPLCPEHSQADEKAYTP